jgi:hypothetical protein
MGKKHDHHDHHENEEKIMMFGTGEAGKSTFDKQLRLFNNSLVSDEGTYHFTQTIYTNLYCILYFFK